MLRLFVSTFALIFIAELGDKTQLATLALASRSTRSMGPMVVFSGSALALICTSALAVAAGTFIERTLPHGLLRWVSGILFLGAGAWTLLRH